MTKITITKAEREFLKHLRKPWWNVINKESFYVYFSTGKWPTWRIWTPRGRTGATALSLMRKGLIDFAPKPGVIGSLTRTKVRVRGEGEPH